MPLPSIPVLAFAFLLSLLTGVLRFRARVAHHTATPPKALRGANRSTRDNSSFPQKTLVVVQVALSKWSYWRAPAF